MLIKKSKLLLMPVMQKIFFTKAKIKEAGLQPPNLKIFTSVFTFVFLV